jgi:hypothetical protein
MNIRIVSNRSGVARVRRFRLLKLSIKVVGVAAVDFALLAILAPNLIDMHQDWALAGAIACLVVVLALTGWLAWGLWSDRPSANGARGQTRPHRHLSED